MVEYVDTIRFDSEHKGAQLKENSSVIDCCVYTGQTQGKSSRVLVGTICKVKILARIGSRDHTKRLWGCCMTLNQLQVGTEYNARFDCV